jgi:hypothetical protein
MINLFSLIHQPLVALSLSADNSSGDIMHWPTPMAWTLSMESSGGGGAEESITDAEKEVLLLFFCHLGLLLFLVNSPNV